MKDEAFWVRRVEELAAEIAKLQADYERDHNEIVGRLIDERDELQQRHDQLWEMDRKIIAALKAERDAAFVRGLEVAKVISLRYDSSDVIVKYIQAKIDKAKAGK